MKSLILCEGVDDVYVIGYYLHKTMGWNRNPKLKVTDNYNLNNFRNGKIEKYQLGTNKVVMLDVGGKDNFRESFKAVSDIFYEQPKDCFEQVFIVMDKDDDSEEALLESINQDLKAVGITNISTLTVNTKNIHSDIVEDEEYSIAFVPVLIPFDGNGALENILMAAIASEGSEEGLVVEKAKEYIDGLKEDLKKYLNHERLELKAKFSAVISVTNPERSTATFDKLLMSHDWERYPTIRNNFSAFNKFLT